MRARCIYEITHKGSIHSNKMDSAFDNSKKELEELGITIIEKIIQEEGDMRYCGFLVEIDDDNYESLNKTLISRGRDTLAKTQQNFAFVANKHISNIPFAKIILEVDDSVLTVKNKLDLQFKIQSILEEKNIKLINPIRFE